MSPRELVAQTLSILLRSTSTQRLYLLSEGRSGIRQEATRRPFWKNRMEQVSSPLGNFMGIFFRRGSPSPFATARQEYFSSPSMRTSKGVMSSTCTLPDLTAIMPSRNQSQLHGMVRYCLSWSDSMLRKRGILLELPLMISLPTCSPLMASLMRSMFCCREVLMHCSNWTAEISQPQTRMSGRPSSRTKAISLWERVCLASSHSTFSRCIIFGVFVTSMPFDCANCRTTYSESKLVR